MTLTSSIDGGAHATEAGALLYNGTIHSTAEPYAESMLVKDGVVAWLGSDETAEHVAPVGAERRDLNRGLVAPAFVGQAEVSWEPCDDAEAVLDRVRQALNEAAAGGYGAVRLWIRWSVAMLREDHRGLAAQWRQVQDLLRAHDVQVFPVVALHGVRADGGAPSIQPVNELLDLLELAETSGDLPPAAVAVLWDEVSENLLGVRSWCAEAGRQLLIDCAGVAADAVVSGLVVTQRHLRDLKQTPSASTPTVAVGFDAADQSVWEELLNTGVHVLLTSAGHLATALRVGVPTSAVTSVGENPWQLVSDHVHQSTDPVSVRAGFNAQTRGAYRSLVGASADAGQLVVGASAQYVIWEVESLAVQTPHSTVSAWSTDTRARTPLLPYLDGVTLPEFAGSSVKPVSG